MFWSAQSAAMDLSPNLSRFVLHWGEMGARWGVNRSVAQIHALLYLSERPLTAEEIADQGHVRQPRAVHGVRRRRSPVAIFPRRNRLAQRRTTLFPLRPGDLWSFRSFLASVLAWPPWAWWDF